ncbi:subtilisin-like protease SBT1.9 [Eucalyptus grandis]|uniref:subtilisin-like protease SBT1.9 n=1 Tax=Eucalyptus grandis TaxID=71139 RepID=UPI00192EFD2E|nr:subtilisin-like protease SBT1.9 [Eucalyptus grandis]
MSNVAPALCFVILQFLPSCWSQTKSETYIVHMDTLSMPKVFSDQRSWYLATLSSISEGGATSTPLDKLVYTYSSSVQGFSATLSRPELESLKRSPHYVSSTRDRPLKLHTTHTPSFLGLNSVSGAWPASEYGNDVIIGFVDTGIWPESASFHDNGIPAIPSRWKGSCVSGGDFNASLCNKKIIGARFYHRGLVANNPKAIKVSKDSARDTVGHGTHTSSTAAGNWVRGASYFGYAPGTAVGMAPKCRIAIYKAAWKHGVYASDVIAAIDQAIEDGVDILSLSMGFSSGDASSLGQDPIAVATFAAIKRGVLVVASAGNDGPLHWTLVNGAPWLFTVGASTVDREFLGTLTLGNGVRIDFSTLYPGKYFSSRLPITLMDACDNIQKLERFRDNVIVCVAKLISIGEQIENVLSARVSAAVFISSVYSSEFYTRISFPAAFVGVQAGQALIDYITKSNDPTGTLEFRKTELGKKPAPRVEGYSSRGPYSSCPDIQKPDVIAPGTLVLASWTPKSSVAKVGSGRLLFSDFNLMTGTSMAAPHVAGVAALIKAAHPTWTPAAVRSALMTTAYALDNTGSPIKDAANFDLPASPLATGSGHIDPNKALDPGLVYDLQAEDYLNLLCAMKYSQKKIKIIAKSSHSCRDASNSSRSSFNYPSFIALFGDGEAGSGAVVREFRREVTNVGEDQSSYSARVVGMEGWKVRVDPPRLVFRRRNEKKRYKLTVEGPRVLRDGLVHGSLSWVDDRGKYIVRSPIVATSLVQESP